MMNLLAYLSLLLFVVNLCAARFVLEDNYDPSGILDSFEFFTGPDPTNGFVEYVDRDTAEREGLLKVVGDSLYMGVDAERVTPGGRPSIRITSRKAYNTGLVILDLSHMPGGVCGTWPAFWSFGPNWPQSGEIDIIEGVNDQSGNFMVLHTTRECRITDNGAFSGAIETSNCDVFAEGQYSNEGCRIASDDPRTFGSEFNANGGGVYAMDWTDSYISIYFFPRGAIPSDITENRPVPSSWGRPLAQFQGGCDIREKFINQNLVFCTTFCGDWAGNTWGNSACASRAATCNDFVRDNPLAFRNAYWSVNSLKVYRQAGEEEVLNREVPDVEELAADVLEDEDLTIEVIGASNLTNNSIPDADRLSLDEVIEEVEEERADLESNSTAETANQSFSSDETTLSSTGVSTLSTMMAQ